VGGEGQHQASDSAAGASRCGFFHVGSWSVVERGISGEAMSVLTCTNRLGDSDIQSMCPRAVSLAMQVVMVNG
jgi:hypothetical protein